MLGIKYARELADEGFTVVLLHPGYVKSVSIRFASAFEPIACPCTGN